MNIVGFIVAFGLFVGGVYLMSVAFYVPGFEALVFFLGILGICAALFIPAHILLRVEK